MLNKNDIFKKLNEVNLDKNEYIVISGAAMVALKFKRETSDIDIAVSDTYFSYLKGISKYVGNYDGYEIYKYHDIEFSNGYYNKDNAVKINDIYFQNSTDILKLKQHLNRDKDKKDIKKLELHLAIADNKHYENELYKNGINLICGVDEVGRGPLVGPVVAAAVILPKNFSLDGLTDSKKLSEKKRNEFDKIIKEKCISYGIGEVSAFDIDKVNIYEATKIAMKKAIDNLIIKPEFVLIDAMKLDIDINSLSIIKGDLKSISISAASVIAKVYRDSLMYDLDKKYPVYNFKSNKGYPTKDHLEAIDKYGILKCHRMTYSPVTNYLLKEKDNAKIQ